MSTPPRPGHLALLIAATLASGCRTPAVYSVAYRDPRAVGAELRNENGPAVQPPAATGAAKAPPDPAPQVAAELDAPGASLGPLSAKPYRTTILRGDDGSLSMVYTIPGEAPESALILGADGKIRPTFPTATGDLLDFPGWHQPGVTAIGPGPLRQENGQQRFEFVYRPSFARQRSLGQTGGVVVSLVTPTSNVLSVTRHERPPHGALAFGLAVSAVILAGGAYLAFPRSDDSRGLRNFRLGVGLPLAAVGLAGGTFSVVMLLRSDRDVAIPLEHARGLP